MSIRSKLIIMFLSIALIPLFFMSILTFKNYKKSIEANHISQLEGACILKAELIKHYFDEVKLFALFNQNIYIVKKYLPVLSEHNNDRRGREYLSAKSLLDNIISKPQAALRASNIMLADTRGRIVYETFAGRSAENLSDLQPAFWKTAFKEGSAKIFLSDPFLDPDMGAAAEFLMTAPVYDLEKNFVGIIAIESDMTALFELLANNPGLGQTGETILGKKSGDKILFVSPLKHDEKTALSKYVNFGGPLAGPMQEAIAGKTGAGQMVDYRGTKVIAAWRYIPYPGWGLVSKIDTREAFSDVTNLRNLIIVILGIIIILSGIMAVSLARSISGPINKIAEGASIIGRGNLDYKIKVGTQDELGRLAMTLNQMTSDLKNVTASRDELNKEVLERKKAERDKEMTINFLGLVNESHSTKELIKLTTAFFHKISGCEAVGIRIKRGDDYPYYETWGFPDKFVEMEKSLCSYDQKGEPLRDSNGDPVLECMCGNVIYGRFDPAKPFFTARGSFWANDTTRLLATTTDADRQAHTRNNCNGEGYESVALIALRSGGDRLGLLQFNDHKKGRFSLESITLWEGLADYLAVALAKFKAEESLTESQRQKEFLADILEASSQAFAVGYPDGKMGLMNAAFEDLTGYTAEELRSLDWAKTLTPPEWSAGENDKLSELNRTGNPVRYNKEYIRKDGRRIPIELLVHVVKDEEGVPLFYYSFITDISERKLTEEEIKQQISRLKVLNDELTRFNKAAVDRELRMIELKKEVNELCGREGAKPRYPLDFDK
jgi:PAS domain S-box-containing protein